MVPRFGGRNWTIVSAGLLLIPTIGLAIAVSNPQTPFGVLLLVAALAGLGGGNFASSMANITFFYPAAQKGYALGLNAAGGNLGASVAQFLAPIVITLGAAATLNLPIAGLIWVALFLVAMAGAYFRMDNLSTAKADIAASIPLVGPTPRRVTRAGPPPAPGLSPHPRTRLSRVRPRRPKGNTTVSMSDPFLPVHRDGTEEDPREIDLDHDVDVLFDDGAEGETLPASTATPPFRTPVPGDAIDEEQLDEDLGVTPPTGE